MGSPPVIHGRITWKFHGATRPYGKHLSSSSPPLSSSDLHDPPWHAARACAWRLVCAPQIQANSKLHLGRSVSNKWTADHVDGQNPAKQFGIVPNVLYK